MSALAEDLRAWLTALPPKPPGPGTEWTQWTEPLDPARSGNSVQSVQGSASSWPDDGLHPLARVALGTFPEAERIAAAEVVPNTGDAESGPKPSLMPGVQPGGSDRTGNRARQRVDHIDTRDLADAWMERIAICEVDGGLTPAEAEEVAHGELREAIAAHAGKGTNTSWY